MKKWILLFFIILIPMTAFADISVEITERTDGKNTIDTLQFVADQENGNLNLIQLVLDAKFAQSDARRIYERVEGRSRDAVISQKTRVFENDDVLSMALQWNGEQPSGKRGSNSYTYNLYKDGFEEITLEKIFTTLEDARDRLNEITEAEVLYNISDYLEYADLLPVPLDNFAFDASGITIFYPEERYRYFSGQNGSIHFAWFEIFDLIDMDGVFKAFLNSETDVESIIAFIEAGGDSAWPGKVGDTLGGILSHFPNLSDPDYTKDSKLYLFEDSFLRGFSVEIPKYADTTDMETPVSVIRSDRVNLYGLITGWTGRDDIINTLGNPSGIFYYNEDLSFDMMLNTGMSLFYTKGDFVLELHLDEEELLDTVLLRKSVPEWVVFEPGSSE